MYYLISDDALKDWLNTDKIGLLHGKIYSQLDYKQDISICGASGKDVKEYLDNNDTGIDFESIKWNLLADYIDSAMCAGTPLETAIREYFREQYYDDMED